MDREFRIAIALAGLIAGWIVAAVLLVRYAIPMVLEARFIGAMAVATVIGVAGVLALAWTALLIFRWARRAFSR